MKLTGERKIIAALSIVTLIVTLSTTVLATQAHNPNFEQEPSEASSATTQYSAFSAPAIEWNKTHGGAGHDFAYDVELTSDGGYIMAGTTAGDFWLVKTDYAGNVRWNKSYGRSTTRDQGKDVEVTADGYIIVGYSFEQGWQYIWLVKVDHAGNMEWNRTYLYDPWWDPYPWDVEVTGDGGYIIAGYVVPITAQSDIWLVKTDSTGNAQWNKTYGVPDRYYDGAFDIELTSDGGYVMAGRTESYGAGGSDFWLVKTDASGTMQWNKTCGGVNDDSAYDVELTADGAYIIAGYTQSFSTELRDFWLVRLSAVGIHEHDVAVIGVATSKTIIGQGYPLNLSATIQNQGNHTETFNVTAYYNWTNPIAMQTLTLTNGNYATITFTWNTTTITKGVYTISAHVTPLLGETETTDNTRLGGTVIVTIPGDVNADSIVDVFDLVQVAHFYGTSPACYGGPSYKVYNTDINCDGTIDIFDLVLVAVNYGSI